MSAVPAPQEPAEGRPGHEPMGLPENRRQAATLMSRIGHELIRRSRANARYDKKIAKTKERLTKLQEEKKEVSSATMELLSALADRLSDYCLEHWERLIEKGMRTIKFPTGEVRQRDVGKPTIVIKDKDAFFAEVRRKRHATRLIRRGPEEPDLEALHDNIELAESLRTVEVIRTTKLEIRPAHTGKDRLEADLADRLEWEVPTSRSRAKS